MASGVVVAAPASEPNVLRVRPLAESHVMDLAGGDWSDAAARAGWEAYQRGELEAARAALAPIAARPVAPSWVEYVLGQADYALGEFKDAAVAWERVRTRQPQFQPVYLDLADDYVKINERRKALEVLKTARQRWPANADVLNAQGVIEAGGGDLDAAIKVFRETIALAPKETITYLNLGKALEMQYFQKRHNLQLLNWGSGANEERERLEAIKVYDQYLATGGPYGDLAKEGIARLQAAAPRRRR
jgi:tetratricopeptide (TPR) repeat protein